MINAMMHLFCYSREYPICFLSSPQRDFAFQFNIELFLCSSRIKTSVIVFFFVRIITRMEKPLAFLRYFIFREWVSSFHFLTHIVQLAFPAHLMFVVAMLLVKLCV